MYEISIEENEDCAKLVVSVNFLIEKEKILQTTIGTIEEWIFASFKQKGHENVTIFFDEERYEYILTLYCKFYSNEFNVMFTQRHENYKYIL